MVAEKSAFPKIAAVYRSTPLETLQAWQAFTVTDNAAFYLSKPFSDARFEFRDKALSGQPVEPVRWKRAVRAVGGGDCTRRARRLLRQHGIWSGRAVYGAIFPPAAKAKIEVLVMNVKAAMRARLERLDWMEPGDQSGGAQEARYLPDQSRLSRSSRAITRRW